MTGALRGRAEGGIEPPSARRIRAGTPARPAAPAPQPGAGQA
jgi:hypothetical protein